MTTTLLPAIPDHPNEVTTEDIYGLEKRMTETLPEIDSLELLSEWHAKADALYSYLHKYDLRGPAMGIQRRIEARIGQLLSPSHHGKATEKKSLERKLFPHQDLRRNFRTLALALSGDVIITDKEWQQSRRVLVAMIRERSGETSETSVKEDKKLPKKRRNAQLDSTATLESVIKNSAESAEFASELATPETIKKLSPEQRASIIAYIDKGKFHLTEVAKQITKTKGNK